MFKRAGVSNGSEGDDRKNGRVMPVAFAAGCCFLASWHCGGEAGGNWLYRAAGSTRGSHPEMTPRYGPPVDKQCGQGTTGGGRGARDTERARVTRGPPVGRRGF